MLCDYLETLIMFLYCRFFSLLLAHLKKATEGVTRAAALHASWQCILMRYQISVRYCRPLS